MRTREDVSVAGSSGVVEHALELGCRVKVDFAPDGHEASAVCECLHGDRERGAELSGAEGAIGLGIGDLLDLLTFTDSS